MHWQIITKSAMCHQHHALKLPKQKQNIILKFKTSPKSAHINMRLCRKKVTNYNFFYIQYRSWEIVSQIWWCAHQIGHETISLQCFHISSKIWYSVITSMTWGYMYSFWKVPPTGQEMWKIDFLSNSAHSILHHFAKKNQHNASTNPTLLVGLAGLHNCCLHVS